jgi:hypothetical protein
MGHFTSKVISKLFILTEKRKRKAVQYICVVAANQTTNPIAMDHIARLISEVNLFFES